MKNTTKASIEQTNKFHSSAFEVAREVAKRRESHKKMDETSV